MGVLYTVVPLDEPIAHCRERGRRRVRSIHNMGTYSWSRSLRAAPANHPFHWPPDALRFFEIHGLIGGRRGRACTIGGNNERT